MFEGKSRAGTLPPGVNARYLLGITRNIAEDHEGWEISWALWDARVVAYYQLAQGMQQHRDRLTDHCAAPELLAKT
jgi:hypothetical protein